MLACRTALVQCHAFRRSPPPRLMPLVRGFASALERVRAVQKEEAAAFDAAAKTRVATMPEELKRKLEEIGRLRSSVSSRADDAVQVQVLRQHRG